MRARRAGLFIAPASILASIAVVSGVLASGPGIAASAAATTTTTTPVRANADFVIWADAQRAQILLPFAKKFGKQYGITVAVTPDSGNLEGDFTTATEAGKGPDLVIGAHDWIGDMVVNGVIQPLPMPAIEQKLFNKIALNAVRYQNEIWGVPYAIENVALFRNPALSPSSPATFQQMISEGQALVTAGKAKVPFCDQVGTTGDAYHMEPFYTSGGGYLFGTLKNGDYNPKDVGVGLAGSIAFGKLLYQYGEKGTGVGRERLHPVDFRFELDRPVRLRPVPLPCLRALGNPPDQGCAPGLQPVGHPRVRRLRPERGPSWVSRRSLCPARPRTRPWLSSSSSTTSPAPLSRRRCSLSSHAPRPCSPSSTRN